MDHSDQRRSEIKPIKAGNAICSYPGCHLSMVQHQEVGKPWPSERGKVWIGHDFAVIGS
jgi:hypothetical protein